MSTFLYVEINMVGEALLIMLLYNIIRSGFKQIPIDQQIFNSILILNLLIFVFDTGMWLMDGNPNPVFQIGIYVATTLYYIATPLICFMWYLYANLKLHESKMQLTSRIWFYGIPIIINTVMSLASPFTHWYFVMEEGNHYVRGPLFFVMVSIAFLYLLLSFFLSVFDLLKNGWEKSKSVNVYLILISIWVIFVAVVQTLYFGVSIIWVSCMLACVFIYINLQNKEVSTDHLTGLFNRRRLDQHLYQRVRTKSRAGLLFLIMLDLDEFKYINDNHGHNMGDNALIQAAEILRKTCNRDVDFVARYGGDEFVIVGERSDRKEIEQLIENIYSNAAEYNKNPLSDITIKFSLGYSVLGENDTVESMLSDADEKMYQNKKMKKQSCTHTSTGV